MTQAREYTEAGNVSLYPSDWAIVDEVDTYDAGRSATLRRIIREWDDWRQRRMVDTPADYVTAQVPDGGR